MMPIVARHADLSKFPSVLQYQSKATHVSLGDLHGNALKLIYTLIEEGILEINEEAYLQLQQIYNTPVATLTGEQLAQFKAIIGNAKVNTDKALTLIGDDLADRGSNDYFTLLVLQKLGRSKVNLDILLSNHSAEFIRDYERKQFTGRYNLASGQGHSLTRMHYLIVKGLVNEEEVRTIVKESYIPVTKAISYTISPEGEITLFSHAPIGLETIQAVARKFGLEYDDSTHKSLISSIDRVNARVQQLFGNKELAQLIDREGDPDPALPVPPTKMPLYRLLWNRAVGDELVTKTSSGIKVKFVHGHVGDREVLKNGSERVPSHQNLDSSFGKVPELSVTGYDSFLNIEIQHITRYSADLTAKELTPKLLDDFSTLYINQEAENRFNDSLAALKMKTDELIAKADPKGPSYDSKYRMVAEKARRLYECLEGAGTNFFTTPITRETYEAFRFKVTTAINDAEPEFINHRNAWNDLNSLLQGIIGFLAFILVIPALVISYNSKHGFFANWLSKPPTEASEQLEAFKEGIEGGVFKELDTNLAADNSEKSNRKMPSSPGTSY